MSMKIDAYGLTDIGRVSKVNQDSFFCSFENPTDGNVSFGVFVVADGVGGLDCGEVASSMSTEYVRNWWSSAGRIFFSQVHDDESCVQEISSMLYALNKHLCDYNEKNKIKSVTTFSLLVFSGEKYYIIHSGDSRIYRVNLTNGSLSIDQLTEDHTKNIFKEQDGQVISRSVLIAGVGYSRSLRCYCEYGDVLPGNMFVVGSDGIYKRVGIKQLSQIVIDSGGDTKRACFELISTAKKQGETDNITAIAVFAK